MVEPPEPGVVRCMSCCRLFISPDPERVRRCRDCKRETEEFEPPIVHTVDVMARCAEH